MRILVLSNKCPPDYDGGYELSAFQVASGLRDRGYDVTLLTSQYRPTFTGKKGTEPAWVHRVFHYKEWPNLTKSGWAGFLEDAHRVADLTNIGIRNASELDRWLASHQIDLAYCFGLHGIGLATAHPLAKRAIPTLWHAGNYLIAQDLDLQSLWKKRRFAHRYGMHFLSGAARRMIGEGDYKHIAFLSEAMKKEFVKMGYEPPHSYILPRGIDFPLGHHVDRPRPPNFFMASRLGPEKGYDVVLEACGKINTQANWRLEIAGSGSADYVGSLKSKAKALGIDGRVDFLGMLSREEVLEKMRGAYAFISASLWEEPFGRTNIESLACGAALIAADTGAIREIVGDAECAMIYAKHDATALAEQMTEILENPSERAALAIRGVDRIKQAFAMDRILNLTEDVFEKVMKDYDKPFQRPSQASKSK